MSRSARKPRVAAVSLLLVLVAAACGPTARPTPTPEPTPIPTASPTPAPPDLVAPRVMSQDPVPDGEVATGGVVRITFSEPVSGVSRASVQVSDVGGAILSAAVSLNVGGRTATVIPNDGLTIGSIYWVTLTSAIRDEAGNSLARTTWRLHTGNLVTFAAGTYNGYQFGTTAADLTGFKRATLESASGATASEYRAIDGHGYLLIDAGIWAGYLVPGTPGGTAVDDQAAPLPPLPTCSYVDLPVARSAYADWATSVLDTVFQLPSGYAPTDFTDTKSVGLNGGHLIRAVAADDLAAMVAAAKADGANLAVQSAYRSYRGQVLTFNGWVAQVGYAEALKTSARPGHSEHQLGTAIDFRTVGGASPWTYADWATTTEGAWLAANGWTFGWVMSYPRGTNAVSCYRYEPWHYRYVGRDQAAAIHAAGLTPREWLWGEGFGVR